MLTGRRVVELRQVTRQLKRVCRDIAAHQSARGGSGGALGAVSSTAALKEAARRSDGSTVVIISSRGGRDGSQLFAGREHDGTARLQGVREKILSRRAPVTVSLLERSLFALDCQMRKAKPRSVSDKTANTMKHDSGSGQLPVPRHRDAVTITGERTVGDGDDDDEAALFPELRALSSSVSSGGAADHSSAATHAEVAGDVMNALYILEQERRALLRERQLACGRRLSRAGNALAGFRAEFASARGQRHQAAGLAPEDAALVAQTEEALTLRIRVARDDCSLLASSPLGRPFLSARLWRLLLTERVWVGAVQLQKRDGGGGAGRRGHQFFLLYISLLFARLVLGVVKDYVDGSELSKRSPRFVVSLPSASFRGAVGAPRDDPVEVQEAVETPAADVESPGVGDEDDLLASMLADAGEVHGTLAPTTDAGAAGDVAVPARPAGTLRWMPAHSADALPLLVETLAMFSLVLPEIDGAAAVQAGLAEELVSLLASLQKLATTALVMSDKAPAGGRSRSPLLEPAELFQNLQRLEEAMRETGYTVVASCAEVSTGSAGAFAALSPGKAACLVVELDGLRLLNPDVDPNGRAVLESLVMSIFPELRTNTHRVLIDKSRQSSLLAFATKQHKQKLYQQHGGVAGAERFVLGTVIQRARLEQRKMAAALRDQYMTSVHLRQVAALGRAVPFNDLMALFRVLSGTLTSTADVDAVAGSNATIHDSRLITAALFIAEALLVSGALSEAAGEVRGASKPGQQHGAGSGLLLVGDSAATNLNDLAQFWLTLAALWPKVDTRRELLVQQARVQGGTGGARSADVKTETAIMAFTTETVLSAVNSCLAQRLATLETDAEAAGARQWQARNKSNSSGDRGADAVTAEHIATLALGLMSWHDADANMIRHRSHAAGQQVRLAEKLLREVVLKDAGLRGEVRGWDLGKREVFERRLLECFRLADLLDHATTRAVEKACTSL